MSHASEAVLLVGGKGTRLRPLTLTTPKPLLPVAGIPFVVHQVAHVKAAGVEHVVLATSYRPEIFVDILGDGSAWGVSITYVEDRVPLGTGGAIRNVTPALHSGPEDPVVVLNGDILSGHDVGAQVSSHLQHDADVTLHLVEVPDARAFGCVPTDADGRVTAFLEKLPNPVTNWVNAGAYVFRRSVIDTIPADRAVSVERETFPGLLAEGASVWAWQESAYWRDLGTPASFVAGSRDVVMGLVGGAGRGDGDERAETVVMPGAQVAPTATLRGGTTIGSGVVVGEHAVVDGSVVLDDAVIGSDAVISDSAVGEHATVADGVVLDDAVLGAGARVGLGNELRNGARVWPDVTLPECAVRFSPDG